VFLMIAQMRFEHSMASVAKEVLCVNSVKAKAQCDYERS
jgi:hypothetical protein